MSAMARIYATACERQGKNFFTVPKKLRSEVAEIIEADGYIINEDGTVTKDNTRPYNSVNEDVEE